MCWAVKKTTTIKNYAKRIGVLLDLSNESGEVFAQVKVISVKSTKKRTQFLKDLYGDDILYEHEFELR